MGNHGKSLSSSLLPLWFVASNTRRFTVWDVFAIRTKSIKFESSFWGPGCFLRLDASDGLASMSTGFVSRMGYEKVSPGWLTLAGCSETLPPLQSLMEFLWRTVYSRILSGTRLVYCPQRTMTIMTIKIPWCKIIMTLKIPFFSMIYIYLHHSIHKKSYCIPPPALRWSPSLWPSSQPPRGWCRRWCPPGCGWWPWDLLRRCPGRRIPSSFFRAIGHGGMMGVQ